MFRLSFFVSIFCHKVLDFELKNLDLFYRALSFFLSSAEVIGVRALICSFFSSLHLFSRVSSYFLVQWWCSLLCSVIALVKFASLALWLSETCRILIWKALMYLFFTGLLDDFHQDLISIGHWMENVIYRVSI